MGIDTHIGGVQVIFEEPQEDFETVPMFVRESSFSLLFNRLRLVYVRVYDEESKNRDYPPPAPVTHDGLRLCYHPALAPGW